MKRGRKTVLKQAISFVVAMMLFVSVLGTLPVVAAKEEKVFNPEALLNRLGISAVYDEVDFITRADFAVLAAQALKLKTLSDDNYFTDVSGDHTNYINTLVQLGVVSKSADGLFRPTDIITRDEAVTICLRILGYNAVMKDLSYPIGYLNQAAKLKMLDGVNDGEMTGAEATMLIFNMLNTKYVKQDAYYSNDEMAYSLSDNTYMEEVFGVHKKRGTITSVCGLAMNGKVQTDSDNVIISGVVYQNPIYSDISCYTYLGREVVFYTKANEVSEEVLYMHNESEVLELASEDIIEVKGFNNSDGVALKRNPVLSYDNGKGDSVEVRLDALSTVFINAAASVALSNEDFMPESGTIFLTDSNNDDVYDVIAIEKYVYYLVDNASADATVFDDQYGKETIDLKKFSNGKYVLRHGGKAFDPEVIAHDTVLEVMCNYKADGRIDYTKFAQIQLATNTIKGAAESIKDNKYVFINGTRYRASEELISKIRTNLGRETTFYIGRRNLIIGIGEYYDEDAYEYAYLVDFSSETGLIQSRTARIYTLTSEMLDLPVAKKIRYTGMLNGVYVKQRAVKMEDVTSVVKTRELIKYLVNEDGELAEVCSAVDRSKDVEYVGYDEDVFTLDSSITHQFVGGIMETGHWIDGNTYCIFASTTSSSPEDFEVGPSSLRGSTLKGVRIKGYDARPDLRVKVAVVEDAPRVDEVDIGNGKFFNTSYMKLVTDVLTVVDDDGEIKTQVETFNGTDPESFVAIREDLAPMNEVYLSRSEQTTNVTRFSELKPGDVIAVQLNHRRQVTGYLVLQEYDETHSTTYSEEYAHNNGHEWLPDFWRICGRVTRFTSKSNMTIDASGPSRLITGKASKPIYIVYNARRHTATSPKGELLLTKDDYVWTFVFRTDVRLIIKYEK